MIESMTCLFCNSVFPINSDTHSDYTVSFIARNATQYANSRNLKVDNFNDTRDAINIKFYLCPSCRKHTITLHGVGQSVKDLNLNILPLSNAKQFPEYVPESIRSDYEEACAIVNLSPKASATLSRRCLQGMIRDFWGITNKKSLYDEINSISDKIDPQVRKVLDSVRQIGNIGAHMEKDINLIVDIDTGEAERLIKLIEYLIEQWYVKRHETDELLNSIIDINSEKQKERSSQ